MRAEPARGGGLNSNFRRERDPIGSERWVLHHGEALAVLRSFAGRVHRRHRYGSAVLVVRVHARRSHGNDDEIHADRCASRAAGVRPRQPQPAVVRLLVRALAERVPSRCETRGAPISFFSDWRHLPTTTDVLQAGGFVWRGLVVRDKTEACRPAMGRFLAQCEYIVWGTAGPSQDREDVGCLWGAIREPVRVADKHHITGKPTAVMQQLVRVCPPIGTAVDPFAGSGTTGVAALLEGRRFVGDRGRRRVRDDCARAAPGGRGRRCLNDFRAGQEPLFGRVGT